ncbi:MAG: J domain-containing protein [Ilumatobacter sp.]
MTDDAFRLLGLTDQATPAEVRTARRELARTLHPDVGGDAAAMQRVNAAAADALRFLARPDVEQTPAPYSSGPATSGSDPGRSGMGGTNDWIGTTRDVPSFTIEALPVEAFEALLVAAAELGEVEDDDPPYVLRTLLAAPLTCWCQLDVVPDAGASTVSVSIAAVDGWVLPAIVDVRNAWIVALNGLDWSAL